MLRMVVRREEHESGGGSDGKNMDAQRRVKAIALSL